jgi:hypothetical protein
MADLLARWTAHRGWDSLVAHDCENERDQAHVGLAVADIRSHLTLTHDVPGGYIRAAIVPDHNLDGWKVDHADQLLTAIGDPGFWLFRNHAGYWKVGCRTLRQLKDDQNAITIIDAAVDRCIELCAEWLPDLKEVATTNRSAADIIADHHPPDPASPPSVQLIIDHDVYRRQLGLFIDSKQPSGAGTLAGYHGWRHQKEVEFQQQLKQQGVLLA